MKLVEFIKQFVKIEYLDEFDAYGLYPFPMCAINNGEMKITSLALGGDVRQCYEKFIADAKTHDTVYMALDFPARGDIQSDFACIYTYTNNTLTAVILPYDVNTGVVSNLITESVTLNTLKEDLLYVKNK